MLRSISKAINLIKIDVLKQMDLKLIQYHTTLRKKPFSLLNRKMINLNQIVSMKFTQLMDKISSAGEHETDAEIITRYTKVFDDCNIDGWWVRKHMGDLAGMDMIPHPIIIQAALRSCRRINDYALAIRFLEMVKFKCGGDLNTYKWISDQVKVVYLELGLESPEDLYYDEPELFLDNVTHPFLAPGAIAYRKVKYEVPISRKPPPVCQTRSLEEIDISKKPPPPCMIPTPPTTPTTVPTARSPPVPLRGARKTPKPDDCDEDEAEEKARAKPAAKPEGKTEPEKPPTDPECKDK